MLKTMIRKLTAFPETAVHYSLGSLVLMTHLVAVAVADSRGRLRP